MKEWDLSKLYQSFDDSSFTTDFNQIIKLQKQINTYRKLFSRFNKIKSTN